MAMKHIEDKILEKLFICPDDLNEQEKSAIKLHLEECALCREHAEMLKGFYVDLEANISTSPTERDKAFADKILTRQRHLLPEKKPALHERIDNALSTFVEIIEPYHRPLAQRFISYIKTHPIRVVSGLSIAAALVFATLLFQPMFKDTNPSYARAKDEFLVVYNKNGEELWRKHIGIYFDLEKLRNERFYQEFENIVTVIDVDGDNKNEVIITAREYDNSSDKKTISCYLSNGSQKWKFDFHANATFGQETFTDNYSIDKILVGDFENNGQIQIFAIAIHQEFYPCAVIKIDANNGKQLSEYWHSGSLYFIHAIDVDKDGKDEIVCGGENNGYNLATIIVLDPQKIDGKSPAPLTYSKIGTSIGQEKYYILYPRNDLQTVAIHKRNRIQLFSMRENYLEVHVAEEIGSPYHLILLYYFHDSTMVCTKVTDTDPFVQLHHKLEKQGILKTKLNDEYYENLRKKVQYWDGEKFVNYPTMNKKYVAVAMRLP